MAKKKKLKKKKKKKNPRQFDFVCFLQFWGWVPKFKKKNLSFFSFFSFFFSYLLENGKREGEREREREISFRFEMGFRLQIRLIIVVGRNTVSFVCLLFVRLSLFKFYSIHFVIACRLLFLTFFFFSFFLLLHWWIGHVSTFIKNIFYGVVAFPSTNKFGPSYPVTVCLEQRY